MEKFVEFLTELPSLSPDRLIGLIALGALALAGFAIYVVFAIVTERKQP